jgi:hypothetical protein
MLMARAMERRKNDASVHCVGEMESGNAGEPARLIRQRYREAADTIKKGKMCSLFINDLDAGAGRMGGMTQYTVNNQMCNATLMNIADNPTNVQLPGVYKNDPIPRVPVICTGALLLPRATRLHRQHRNAAEQPARLPLVAFREPWPALCRGWPRGVGCKTGHIQASESASFVRAIVFVLPEAPGPGCLCPAPVVPCRFRARPLSRGGGRQCSIGQPLATPAWALHSLGRSLLLPLGIFSQRQNAGRTFHGAGRSPRSPSKASHIP